MRNAAADLEFEEAARLRDEIKRLEAQELAAIGADLDGLPWKDGEAGENAGAILATQRAERTRANLTKRGASSGKGRRKRRARRGP